MLGKMIFDRVTKITYLFEQSELKYPSKINIKPTRLRTFLSLQPVFLRCSQRHSHKLLPIEMFSREAGLRFPDRN